MTNAPVDSPPSDHADSAPAAVEDATTTATREELSHTTISESDKAKVTADSATSPDSESTNTDSSKADELHEIVASPKKKRVHDQILDTPDKAAAQNAGPEKKRARDEDAKPSDKSSTKSSEKNKTTTDDKDKKLLITSASAFAKSGFAARAASTVSPFGTSTTSSTSIFGSGTSSALPFGSSAASTSSSPKLSFGSSAGASPFSSLNGAASGTKTFGSSLGSGGSIFGSASKGFGGVGLGGGKLSSFATPGEATFGAKSAKPFGAPESDAESEDEKTSEENSAEEKGNGEEKSEKPDKVEKEKKVKLHKVEVNDGESGEATILSVRARLYHLDKDMGWKERGAGNVKINVPEASVDFDNSGAIVPGSFDASALADPEANTNTSASKGARIIMRQDQTGRVILNTVLVPAMKFQLKEGLKSTGILFTAFEEGKPVNVHLKMTAINAKNWMNEVGVVQRELSTI